MVNQIVMDLDAGEETEVTMDQQVLSNPPVQDMDVVKEPEEDPNLMSTMTIVNPLMLRHLRCLKKLPILPDG